MTSGSRDSQWLHVDIEDVDASTTHYEHEAIADRDASRTKRSCGHRVRRPVVEPNRSAIAGVE
jgi:hypothetical protein